MSSPSRSPLGESRHETELRRLNRTLRMLGDSRRAVLRAQNEVELLNAVCGIVVTVGGYQMAWAGLAEGGAAASLRPVAHVGPPPPDLPAGPPASGPNADPASPAAKALRTGRPHVVPDLAADPDYGPWREAAGRLGYRAAIALPLTDEGRTLGTLALYAGEIGPCAEDELATLTELAGDIGCGIAALRARAELRRQARMTDAFFQQAISSFVVLDRNYHFVRANAAFAQFYGLEPEDFHGQPAHFLYPETNTLPAEYQAMLDEVVATKRPITRIAVPHVSPAALNRAVTYWDSTLQPILDEAGEVEFIVFGATESTALVQAQHALQQVLRHARTTVMRVDVTAPAGWRERDAAWAMENFSWNGRCEDELAAQAVMPVALEPGERYYDGWMRSKLRDADRRGGRVAVQAFLSGASSWEREFQAVDREGRIHWFAQVASVAVVGDGRWQVTSINTDISALKDTEHQLRALTDNSPDFVARYDRDHRALYVNRALESWMNVTPGDMIGRRLGETSQAIGRGFGTAEVEAMGRMIDAAFATAQRIEADVPGRGSDREVVVNVRIVPEVNEVGAVTSVLAMARDVTALKDAERERQMHLWVLECMDRIDCAIQGAPDLEWMMRDVLDVVLDIFGCDRAWLVTPCDPAAAEWQVPMERTRPPHPGGCTTATRFPMDAEVGAVMRRLLATPGPVAFGNGAEPAVPAAARSGGVQSFLATAIHPKVGQPYLFAIHPSSRPRVWRPEEETLFREIGRRLADALTSLLTVRRLRESERRLEEAQRIAHVGYWERDLATGTIGWSDETYRICGLEPRARAIAIEDLRAMIHPDDRARVQQVSADALQNGRHCGVEYRLIRPDGSERVVYCQGEVVRSDAGEPRRMFGTVQDITDRKRAEEALRESEARLELANRAAGIGPWDWNLLTNDVHFSAEWKRQLGHEEHEVASEYREWESRLHPADRERTLSHLRAYLAGTEPSYELEIRLRHKDGSYRWIFTRGEVLRDREGRPVRMIGCHLDITTRKEAEDALRASQEAYGALVNTVDGIVWEVDVASFCFTFVSRQAERLLGYPVERWLQDASFWPEHLHPEDRTWAVQFCATATAQLRDHEFYYRMIAADGRTVWLHDIVTVVVEDGRPTKLRGIMVDVTAAKASEEALRWRTALFEAQMDAGLDGILVVDEAGKKILQNRRMAEVWKIPPAVAEDPDDAQQIKFVTGRTRDPQQFLDKIQYLYANRDEVSRDEIELIDGTMLDRYSAPVRDRSGKYYGRIWTFRDVTATRQLEQQLRQAQKMEAVGRLAGGIAHDFNNLLTVIQMQASMVLAEPGLASGLGQSVRQIMGAAHRAAVLTRQLLTFSRREAKEARLVDLGEVIGNLTRLVRRILGEDISMETRFASGLPAVQADSGMMEQVLMNLLVNARDAMPEGGVLTLSLQAVNVTADYAAAHPSAEPGRFVCLAVTDTGMGIPPENLPRIFEPFFTTKEVGKGTGLGLATVFGIVEEHQGWVDVESVVGRGTTFRVYIPASEQTPEAAGGRLPIEKAPGGSETILLVEDEPIVRALAAATLQRQGYRVFEASTGPEALRRWEEQQGRFDLLLTDLVMPGGLTGQKLADDLSRRNPSLRVVYTSGYHDTPRTEKLRLEPGQNFLAKPYSIGDLILIIRRRLDQS